MKKDRSLKLFLAVVVVTSSMQQLEMKRMSLGEELMGVI
jgi:hypothetical protein